MASAWLSWDLQLVLRLLSPRVKTELHSDLEDDALAALVEWACPKQANMLSNMRLRIPLCDLTAPLDDHEILLGAAIVETVHLGVDNWSSSPASNHQQTSQRQSLLQKPPNQAHRRLLLAASPQCCCLVIGGTRSPPSGHRGTSVGSSWRHTGHELRKKSFYIV
ncbi:hypothetical protein ZWY2020_052874 [Hordeum vulgare]|nr:hypothetical protein ZWY2020_052874 [Hordeum vulgare]